MLGWLKFHKYRDFLLKQWLTAHSYGLEQNYAGLTAMERGVAEAEFTKIMDAYRSKGRHYHAVSHLYYGLRMIDMLEKLRDERMDPRDRALLVFAFFYHDFYYDVFRSDNEAMSAARARKYLLEQQLMADADFARIETLIVETADHQKSTCTDPLWEWMNDIDLAIMVAPWRDYKKYAINVWKEYRVRYKRGDFVKGRAAFLRQFMNGRIFYFTEIKFSVGDPIHDDGYDPTTNEDFRDRATKNLSKEIAFLENEAARA